LGLIWLLRDLDLLSVLARAATLSFEALLVGGVSFLLLAARPAGAGEIADRACRRGIRMAAIAFAAAETVSVAISCASVIGGSGVPFKELVVTDFFLSGVAAIVFAIVLWAGARGKASARVLAPAALLLVAACVATSHAVSRLDHRVLLTLLTGGHHLGSAAWIGAMPFLLVALPRASTVDAARRMARRFSSMAMISAAVLVLAGIGMSWFYVGSWSGLYGTVYGGLLLAKIYLLLVILALGSGNWLLVRRLDRDPQPLLVRLRRFAEVEIGLGFTAILIAASLTAQPPAADVAPQDRPTLQQIDARMHPELPRMSSPPAAALTPPTSMSVAIQESEYGYMAASDANDRAWSEYNHHWAGLVVLIAGVLALLSRFRFGRWARFWPLSFAGLAVFILLRADPENWPLGPRPFWASFSAPDVLQHRLAALLILLFAVFECAVQAGKLRARWATQLFPWMCILGSAVLFTHDHAVQDLKEELFAEMSHTPIALMGVTAGWGRWLELRLPSGKAAKIAGYLWPVCLAMAGLILLNYRES
jgi:putative copper resistance protein D